VAYISAEFETYGVKGTLQLMADFSAAVAVCLFYTYLQYYHLHHGDFVFILVCWLVSVSGLDYPEDCNELPRKFSKGVGLGLRKGQLNLGADLDTAIVQYLGMCRMPKVNLGFGYEVNYPQF